MAILHFDTDAGTTTVQTLNACKANIQAELTKITGKVQNLTGGEWSGQSSVDFQNEIQAWKAKLDTELTNLETLRTKLDREIQEWVQVAQAFG